MMLARMLTRLATRAKRTPAPAADRAKQQRVLEQASGLAGTGRYAEAERVLREATLAWPDWISAQRLLGSVLGATGQLREARSVLERVVALDPDDASCLADLGNVLRLEERPADAESCYRRALALDPDNRAVRFNLALLLQGTGQDTEAIARLTELTAPPAHPQALKALVAMLDRQARPTEAIAICTRVLSEESEHAAAHASLGFVLLKRLLEPAAALDHLDRALRVDASDAEVHANRAIALQDLGRMDEALASYEAAFALDPTMHAIRFHRALGLLLLGRYDEAWGDYELRHLGEERGRSPVERRVWNGEDLAQRSLLIYGEQGLGDEIMFASCIPDVLRRCPNVVIACAPKLVTLFRRSFAGTTCVAGGAAASAAQNAAIPATDLMVASGSLPREFRRTRADFPTHRSYLEADAEQVAVIRRRLQAFGPGLKVGISWRGGTAKSRQMLRTLPAELLNSLLDTPGVKFVNLQYDSPGSEPEIADAVRVGRMLHLADALADYDKTAALVCALDLVVSVCTALIHLTGALGRPVWILAPQVPEWRYGLHGEHMPWYPSASVIRQGERGDWGPVIAAVKARLQASCS